MKTSSRENTLRGFSRDNKVDWKAFNLFSGTKKRKSNIGTESTSIARWKKIVGKWSWMVRYIGGEKRKRERKKKRA